ncbi:MAG: pyridoxamine 5'-phosphate oxidase family protein [Bacteriovoracaceae bacterium]|nr:pyridoxamine 5'-phosphate oxidase family protein [Bacteroidota bacterium]
MSEFSQTELNKIRRLPQRGQYDKETVYSIVDEALICHVGFVQDGQPFVIPTIHVRIGDTIYLHGAVANRMLNHIKAGNTVCVTITHIDGIVFARSVFHHSMNYRSAMLFGKGRVIEDEKKKWDIFAALTEHIAKGRWEDSRHPNEKETRTTTIVAIDIETASAKSRTGGAKDEPEDYALPYFAGVLPVAFHYEEPVRDENLPSDVAVPEYLAQYKR